MKLSEKTLQNLKDRTIKIENLNDEYFVNHSEGTNNILELLNNNICFFQEIVDRFKNTKDLEKNISCLYKLLWNKKLFKKLIENNELIQKDSKYLLNNIDSLYDLQGLCSNSPLIKKLLKDFILTNEDIERLNEKNELITA